MYPNIHNLSGLVSGIGTNNFNQLFYDFSQELLNAKHCIVFRFNKEERPQCLLAEAQHSQSRTLIRGLAQEYTTGAYQDDPNLEGSDLKTIDRPVIRWVIPKSIRDINYRKRFYDEAQVRQELALIAPCKNETFYFSFMRTQDQKEFCQEDITQLRQTGEFIITALNKHYEIMSLKAGSETTPIAAPKDISPERRQQLFDDMRTTLINSPAGLTNREAEVCAAIALGYTTLGISLNLGISINTVATHRKRAYAKLGISSQNELFAQYVGSIEHSGIRA